VLDTAFRCAWYVLFPSPTDFHFCPIADVLGDSSPKWIAEFIAKMDRRIHRQNGSPNSSPKWIAETMRWG
jgi:hypothetical protein